MDTEIEVRLILADYMSLTDGKLNAMGIGWTFTSPGPVNMAIGGLVLIPWDRTNTRYQFTLGLYDQDGQSVPKPDGSPLVFETPLEAGRPPGHTPGSPITAMLPPVNIFGLVLPPGSRYEWVARIGADEWRVGFNTLPAPAPVGSQ